MQHSNTAGCILLKFYIKPQHTANVYNLLYVVSYRNSTSNHNMSHWRATSQGVVSYRNSTSNHNLALSVITGSLVVSYRNSTSNHNNRFYQRSRPCVVSYRNSTSNHNLALSVITGSLVVSYRNSTSNHNTGGLASGISGLYLIEILHQTTTMSRSTSKATTLYLIEILHQTTTLVTLVLPLLGCILSKFYIKPQQAGGDKHRTQSCILSKFYIKPQPPLLNSRRPPRCILSKFYIKPQQSVDKVSFKRVVSYRNSTSNHNRALTKCRSNVLYLIEILHQTTTEYETSASVQGLYLIEILHQTTTL